MIDMAENLKRARMARPDGADSERKSESPFNFRFRSALFDFSLRCAISKAQRMMLIIMSTGVGPVCAINCSRLAVARLRVHLCDGPHHLVCRHAPLSPPISSDEQH